MIGAAHRFFVVLDDDQRISFVSKRGERFEQAKVVAWVQTDGWFIQHVKNAAQIRTKLRSQTDSLRLAAAQCFRRTSKRKVTESDFFHETQSLLNFGNEASGYRLIRSFEF